MKTRAKLIRWEKSHGDPGAETLVVLLHGMDCGPDTMAAVAASVRKAVPSSYVLIPKLPFGWAQCADLRLLCAEIIEWLDENVTLANYRAIRLVGHSAGGALAQAVHLLSRELPCGLGRVSAGNIRLILIAPMRRGWRISHHLPLAHKIAWTVGMWLVPVLKLKERVLSLLEDRVPHELWTVQLQRGAPFVVWLRLAWLELADKPEIFILLGSVDELVSWRDMVDEVTSGDNAVHLQVSHSDHARIIDFEDRDHGRRREERLIEALTKTPAEAAALEHSVEPWDADPAQPDPLVKRVVFVIHGIRDEGHWTQKIAARARASYAAAGLASREEIQVVTSSYGYFSMLEFLLSSERELKIHWLMDQYVEIKRRFPRAEFSFIGHSNGTYLLAQALAKYPAVKFERIAFAGSVVSSRYDWEALAPRVKWVLNFTATSDWVVALFPRIADIVAPLGWLLGPNLGGAGIEPFQRREKPSVESSGYMKGQHSAAIHEDNWDALALFAVAKEPPPIPTRDTRYATRPWRCFDGWLGRAAAVAAWLALVVVLLWAVPFRLAWANPVGFWLPPSMLIGVSVLAIAFNQGRAQGASFPKRAQVARMTGWILAATALLLVAGLVWSGGLAALDQWRVEVDGKWRMLSLVLYFWLLHKALTKV